MIAIAHGAEIPCRKAEVIADFLTNLDKGRSINGRYNVLFKQGALYLNNAVQCANRSFRAIKGIKLCSCIVEKCI